MRKNPLKKNSRFYLGMVLNVAEGMLSGFNFLLLYEAMKMLWNGTINSPSLLRLSLFLGGIFILRIVIYSIGYTQSQIGGAAVSNRTRLFLGDKIKRIPLSRFTQGQTGQYINIVTSDVNNYEKILTHTVGDIVKHITFCTMMVIFVGCIWLPGGIILACVELVLIPFLWLSFRVVRKYGTEKNAVSAETVSSIVEYATGIQTFRAYGIGGTKNETVTSTLQHFSDVSYNYEKHGIPTNAIQCIFLWIGLPVMIWAASIPMLSGKLDPISYLLICMLPMLLAKLSDSISRGLMSYKNLKISKDKVVDIIEEPEETGSMEPLQTATHEITFDSVDFSYVPGEPVLKHATFTVPDQKLTAIVGDSGSGKSTILNLIAKYYEANGGTISIGGKPINHVAAERVLEQISMVDQDVFLFDDTIRDNIRHARPNATDEEIEAACREAKPCKLCLIDDLTISLQPKHCLFVLHGPCPFWEGFQSWLGYIFIHLPAKIYITVDQEGNLSHIRRDFFIFISEIHAKTRTTTVRTAVATVESVFLIPHFARIDVTPAKKAEPAAYRSHILHSFFPKCILLLLIIPQIPPVFHLQYLLMTISGHQSHFVSIFFPNVAF